jgi:hypothetical protein
VRVCVREIEIANGGKGHLIFCDLADPANIYHLTKGICSVQTPGWNGLPVMFDLQHRKEVTVQAFKKYD